MAHLVADAVGAPAERQLRQVAGADHQPAALVGEAEQVIGPEARLHVLEGDVVDRLACRERVPHVGQHLARGGADVDLRAGDAQRVHQSPGIALGRLAGGEAGESEAQDRGPRQSDAVGRLGRHDQRVRRIEPARHADHQRLRTGRDHALGQPLDLDVERLVTIGVELLGRVGDEGEAADVADQADVGGAGAVLEGDAAEACLRMAGECRGVVERAEAQPLLRDPFQVDVTQHYLRIVAEARRLGDQLAQLVNHPLAVPGEIGGALARSGGGVDVGADRAHRLRGAQQLALARLADRDVRCRQVAAHQRARQRAQRRRRGGGPVILADFGVEYEVGEVGRGEDQVGAERRLLPGDRDRQPGQPVAAREPALLVIFAVVGQECLGHHAQHATARDRDRAIVEAPGAWQRRADQQHRGELRARRDHLGQRGLGRGVCCRLQVEVVDGVGTDVEFGKDQQVGAACVALAGQRDRRGGVGRCVADAGDRRAGADADHAVAVQRVERMRHGADAISLLCGPAPTAVRSDAGMAATSVIPRRR